MQTTTTDQSPIARCVRTIESPAFARARAMAEAEFVEWRASATPGAIDLLSMTVSRSGLPVDRWETVALRDVRTWLGR